MNLTVAYATVDGSWLLQNIWSVLRIAAVAASMGGIWKHILFVNI